MEYDWIILLGAMASVAVPTGITMVRVGMIVERLERLATVVREHLEAHIRWEERLYMMQAELYALKGNFGKKREENDEI